MLTRESRAPTAEVPQVGDSPHLAPPCPLSADRSSLSLCNPLGPFDRVHRTALCSGREDRISFVAAGVLLKGTGDQKPTRETLQALVKVASLAVRSTPATQSVESRRELGPVSGRIVA